MKLKLNISVLILITTLIVFTSCRKIELVTPTEYESVNMTANPKAEIIGMYLLNEGNMGSNKASIDFLDYRTAIYARNIYAEKNPTVVKELGDVGNDIQVYKDRLYAVINCSHKVEVMDAYSCKRITHIDIPNCRYIRFDGDYGYVSSYVGPVSVDPNAVKGAIFKIDLATNTIVDKVTVGYQPEEMEIINNRLYV
ncbi:MAG: YncE family protein, partial [Bacteroides sp.]|nr:YncE family protein [Bacteroides sp.]